MVIESYQNLLKNFANFKAVNTEYLCYEVDHDKVKEAEWMVEREESRIKEVKILIERNRAVFHSDQYLIDQQECEPEMQTSLLNIEPADSASNFQSKASSSSYLGQLKFKGQNAFFPKISKDDFTTITSSKFPPRRPSVASNVSCSTKGSLKSLQKLKYFVPTADNMAQNLSLNLSQETFTLNMVPKNNRAISDIKLPSQAADKFIDELIEG